MASFNFFFRSSTFSCSSLVATIQFFDGGEDHGRDPEEEQGESHDHDHEDFANEGHGPILPYQNIDGRPITPRDVAATSRASGMVVKSQGPVRKVAVADRPAEQAAAERRPTSTFDINDA